MKVQIISDIHLEMYGDNFSNFESIIKPEINCTVLFLAGDIGYIHHPTFKPFMNYVSENWNEIYYVCGNHEFYQTKNNITKCKTIEDLETEYEEFFLEYWNIYYLHNNYTYENQSVYHIWNEETGILYFILGNTGWSFYDNDSDSDSDSDSDNMINDTKYIYTKSNNNHNIDKLHNLKLHLKCLKNIQLSISNYKKDNEKYKWDKIYKIEDKYIDKVKDVKFICLTHFPYAHYNKVSHNYYHYQPEILKNYFCNDYSRYNKYLDMYDIFIAGHTHYSYDYKEGFSKRFISNQKGYYNENYSKNKDFKMNCCFEI